MFRNLITSQLTQAHKLVIANISRRAYRALPEVYQQLSQQNQADADTLANDIDAVEDMPTKFSRKKLLETRRILTHKFKHFLNCSDLEANQLINKNKTLIKLGNMTISRNIEFLFEKQIKARTIVENPWLLSVSSCELIVIRPDQVQLHNFLLILAFLEEKIKAIEKLHPKNLNDFIPLSRVSLSVLTRTQKIMNRERNHVPEGNRIYFLSSRLGVEPDLVSKYFSTHMFMFTINFDMLVENLNILLEYEITPVNILRDLWAFKYLPSSIRSRLERCQQADKDNLKPWMIRCPEDVLKKTLTLSQESKNLLGDDTMVSYLSQRLGYDEKAIKCLVEKNEIVTKVRITKVR